MEKTQEKYLNLISAEVIADSLNQFGERITTMKLVFPRIILAELNTHRMFNRNSASSRAIPFKKMVKIVEEQPFIPIAWQKEYKGMQGTEYAQYPDTEDFKVIWLEARDNAIKSAQLAQTGSVKLTKQLCNRLLEPFMWTTMLITGSKEGWENFFNLRLPEYYLENIPTVNEDLSLNSKTITLIGKSKKELLKEINQIDNDSYNDFKTIINNYSDLDWLQLNKGQAEIHMMALAECIYDAMNESTPKQLEVGQWHIPFGDNIKEHLLLESFGFLTPTEIEEIKVKIAVARCARLSYETLGDNPVIDYCKDIALHNTLLAVKHMSPFEHCAVVMENEEYYSHIKGNIETQIVNVFEERRTTPIDKDSNVFGWSRNLKGFKQYREIIEYGK